MVRRLIGLVSLLLVAVMPSPALAQLPSDFSPACIGRSGFITASASFQPLATALEVDLVLENAGPLSVRFDPAKTVLRTGDISEAPWTADQVKRGARDLGAYFLAGAIFPPLLAITGISQLNFNRYVDSRALRAGVLPPGTTMRGSLFFGQHPEARGRVLLELSGFTPDSGALRPIRLYCVLLHDGSSPGAGGSAPLTVSLSAKGVKGPAEVVVETVEFTADYTAVELRISNSGDAQAEIFGAMVNASLRDGSGQVYAGRPARSQFAGQVAAKDSVEVRLVFEALPPPPRTAAATLGIPGIWFGPEDAVDVVVELRF